MSFDDTTVSWSQRFLTALSFGAMVPGGDIAPAWSPVGSAVAVLNHDPTTAGLMLHELGGTSRLCAPMEALCEALKTEPRLLSRVAMTWLTPECLQLDLGGRRVLVDITSGQSQPEADEDRTLRLRRQPQLLRPALLTNHPPIMELPSPDGAWLATERDNDLWLRRPDGQPELRLTHDGRRDARWELDFGAWSADSRHLLALRADNAGVPTLPIITWTDVHEQVVEHPYPRTGDKFPRTTAHLFDIGAASSVTLELGDDELFWIAPAGSTQGGELLVLTSGRYNKNLTLHAIDASNGHARVVVEERADTFVYGIRLQQFATNAWPSPSLPELIWMSERDGYRHAYRYDLDGNCLAQLTSGPFEVERILGQASDGRVFLLAHSDVTRPYDVHICSVRGDGTDFRQLSTDAGLHTGWLSPDGRHLLDAHSSLDRPPRTDLITSTGEQICTVSNADVRSVTPMRWQPPEEIRARAMDGETELQGVLLHPPGFDPARRYPLIEVMYGGPQEIAQPRDFRQSANPLAFALAQLGFVVLVLDGPGTPGRGKAYQDTVFGRFGQGETVEHAAVVRRVLRERPYLDPERVGIVGGSWGGYMVLRALATEPETYRVGASLYGVGDLYDHMARAIEPYMGPLEENADGYAAAAVLPLLKNVSGKLLVLHGTSDVNAALSACMKIIDALTNADKDFDLVVVPGMQHAFVGPGAVYGLRRTAAFLVDNLHPVSP